MSLVEDQKAAHLLVDAFAKKHDHAAFRKLNRHKVAAGLRDRIDDPYHINQRKAGLCGPASLLFTLAFHERQVYAQLVIELFERGHGKLRKWELRPSHALLHHDLGAHPHINQADWIPLASIRNCEDWFFEYTSITDNGGTSFLELEDMFHKAGYTSIVSSNNIFFTANEAMLWRMDKLVREKYTVCVRINSALLKDKTSTWSFKSNHWVTLTEPVCPLGNGYYHFRFFTWGKYVDIDEKLDRFLSHLYGFVACKW